MDEEIPLDSMRAWSWHSSMCVSQISKLTATGSILALAATYIKDHVTWLSVADIVKALDVAS